MSTNLTKFELFKIIFTVSSITVVLTHAVVFEYHDFFANNVRNIVLLTFVIPVIAICLWSISNKLQVIIYDKVGKRNLIYRNLKAKRLITSNQPIENVVLPAARNTSDERYQKEIGSENEVLELTEKQRGQLLELIKNPDELENILRNYQG